MRTHRILPSEAKDQCFLTYTGMETDLLFTQGIDLPGFASFPLLESAQGRAQLRSYYEGLIAVAQAAKTGAILETPTWVASCDRGAQIGYAPDVLAQRNAQAATFVCGIRDDLAGETPVLVSGNVGPRSDAYLPANQMTPEDAKDYHQDQLSVLAQAGVDMISAYTMACADETIGIVRAAHQSDVPVVVAFTVETDGHLPTGESLGDTIQKVDGATDAYAAYYMINCAHPDHFTHILNGAPWMDRLCGVVANASRCSHAELDEAVELDDGDPVELGQQLAALRQQFPDICVLGGCCGTDMRHMRSLCAALHNT